MATLNVDKPELKVQPTRQRGRNIMNDMMSFKIPFLDSPGIRGSYRGAWDLVNQVPEKAILTGTILNAK